jgi:hypothetical protein
MKLFTKPVVYVFHMRSGQSIKVRNIKHVVTTDNPNGSFASYEIQWVPGKSPIFFSLSLPDLIAITTE